MHCDAKCEKLHATESIKESHIHISKRQKSTNIKIHINSMISSYQAGKYMFIIICPKYFHTSCYKIIICSALEHITANN
jgi:hypothetical protein